MIGYYDLAIVPQLIFAIGIAIMLSGAAGALHKKRKAVFALNLFMMLAVGLLASVAFASGTDMVVFGIFHVYALSLLLIALFSVTSGLVYALSYERSSNFIAISLLLGFSFFGMLSVAASNAALTTILGLELVAIPSAFMVAVGGKSRVEPAVKLFIMGGMAVSALLFALALLLPANGALSLGAIAAPAGAGWGYLILLAMILFAVGLAFDASIFPFNLWVPDVYEGSEGNITALLAGVNKKVAFAAMITVFFGLFAAYSGMFSQIFALLAVLTMFFGNIVALTQKSVKRMLAYSSISQAGYIMVGLAAATTDGIAASLFQIIAHSFMIIGAFAIVAWLEARNIKTRDDYAGLAHRNGFGAFALTVFMLSMAGMPPLIGFYGKVLLFSSAIGAGMLALAAIGVLNSFISIYYYGKVIATMYARREHGLMHMERVGLAVVIICLAVVVAFGLYPNYLVGAVSAAAASMHIPA